MKKVFPASALLVAMMFTVAAHANDTGHGKGRHEGVPPYLEETLDKIPAKDAAQFRATLKQSREKNLANYEKMNKLKAELHDIASADTFDKKAFVAKNKQLEELHSKMHFGMANAFAEALAKLPPNERKTVADAIHEGHHTAPGSDNGEGDKPVPDSDSEK